MPLDSIRDRFPTEPEVDLGGKSARQYMDAYDTRHIAHGSPYDQKDLGKVGQGLSDAYISSIMELPMMAMEYLMPDDPYEAGVLQSGPQDRMREEEFKWQEHMGSRAKDPSYATGQDFGQALGVIADPFIDAPLMGVPALGKMMKLSPDTTAKTTGGLMGQLLDETGAIKAQRGESQVIDDIDYRGQHQAPARDLNYKSSGDDMSDVYPEDIYGMQGAQYYGHYGQNNPMDRESINIIRSMRNNPKKQVTVYRAVPKETSNADKIFKLEQDMTAFQRRGNVPSSSDIEPGANWYDRAWEEKDRLSKIPEPPITNIKNINTGDWITINRKYAKEHGESALNGEYKIISKKVNAGDIFTDGDSIHEWGYNPS